MTTNNPIVVGGKEFKELAMSLAVSPLLLDNFLSATVSLTLKPVRRDESGVLEILEEPSYWKTINLYDVYKSTDQAVLQCVGSIQYAIQQFINAKQL